MSSLPQYIAHSFANAAGKIICRRKGLQRLCILATTMILICTMYLFKANNDHPTTLKDDAVLDRSEVKVKHEARHKSNTATTDFTSTTQTQIPLLVEHKNSFQSHGKEDEVTSPCQPHHSVVMIKTHKSSSSTIQNILLRKAENNHLKCALPKEGVYLTDYAGFRRDSIYRDDGGKKYNIMASHMKFTTQDFPAIAAVMENGTKWLSVLRDPVKQFESIYTYYGWQQPFHVDLHTFLRHPWNYFWLFQGDIYVTSRNPMSYDNGLDSAAFLKIGDPSFDRFISVLDGQLDLVLLADYFDESLILLKDLMCWSLEDIAYLNSNSRAKESVENLTSTEEQAIREWNWADTLLYQHFNQTLHDKIGIYGRDKMSEELEKLQHLKKNIRDDCIKEKLTDGDARVWYPEGIKVNSFIANPEAKDPNLCKQLCTPELTYLQNMRQLVDDGEDTTEQESLFADDKKLTDNVRTLVTERGFVLEHAEGDNSSVRNKTWSHDVLPGDDEAELLPKEKADDEVTNESNTREAEGRLCHPLNRITMIKTHKCSSSTLQNILLRRVDDHGLSIALPKESVYFSQAFPFNRTYIFMDDGKQTYDIMASHMKFNLHRFQDIKNVMHQGTKYITILRDPADQYESMYTYYDYRERFGANIHTFLLHPDMYFSIFERRHSLQAGRNPMCHDNGFDARYLEPGDPDAERFMSALDIWHDLVLIAEYFDESLILLKELMCWELEDVVYFKQNARSKESVLSLTSTEEEAIRKWNWADTLLYKHFNRTLWEKVAAYGEERMSRDVAKLRARNEELSEDCVSRTMDRRDPRMWYPPGIKVESFQIKKDAKNPHLCSQMTLPEPKYLDKLRLKRSQGG